jgi:multidrug resistance efflux pump
MSQESAKPDETPASVDVKSPPPQPPPPAKPGKGSRLGAIIVLILIVASLAWYFVSDRLTPYTSQARVQAFVVPVAAEVSGTVLKVHVKNNDEVQRGQPLFDIDPTQYKIARNYSAPIPAWR